MSRSPYPSTTKVPLSPWLPCWLFPCPDLVRVQPMLSAVQNPAAAFAASSKTPHSSSSDVGCSGNAGSLPALSSSKGFSTSPTQAAHPKNHPLVTPSSPNLKREAPSSLLGSSSPQKNLTPTKTQTRFCSSKAPSPKTPHSSTSDVGCSCDSRIPVSTKLQHEPLTLTHPHQPKPLVSFVTFVVIPYTTSCSPKKPDNLIPSVSGPSARCAFLRSLAVKFLSHLRTPTSLGVSSRSLISHLRSAIFVAIATFPSPLRFSPTLGPAHFRGHPTPFTPFLAAIFALRSPISASIASRQKTVTESTHFRHTFDPNQAFRKAPLRDYTLAPLRVTLIDP